MPKDEFDFEDPLELNGVALLTDEDTSGAMAECFVEEFMRMGYNHKQVLALFRNPHYTGMNMVLQNKGEPFVRDVIADVFARWGKVIQWNTGEANPLTPALSPSEGERENRRHAVGEAGAKDLQSVGEPNVAGESQTRTLLSPLPLRGGEGQGEGANTGSCGHGCGCTSSAPVEQTFSLDGQLTDPMGDPIPKLE